MYTSLCLNLDSTGPTFPTDTPSPPTCFDGELSFTSDGTNFTDVGAVFTGTVLVCNNGTFGAVCTQGWDDIDARVACQNRRFNFPDYSKCMLICIAMGGGVYIAVMFYYVNCDVLVSLLDSSLLLCSTSIVARPCTI